jgi:hypothetical protein
MSNLRKHYIVRLDGRIVATKPTTDKAIRVADFYADSMKRIKNRYPRILNIDQRVSVADGITVQCVGYEGPGMG